LNNVPVNLVLNQPNTNGLFAASGEIKLQDGFSVTTSNSFRTLLTAPCPAKIPELLPHFEFLKVDILDKTNQNISSFTVQSVVGSVFNAESIKNKPDVNGNFLNSGEYRYVVKKEGSEIGKGTLIIQ
jgi:hypothetical protein